MKRYRACQRLGVVYCLAGWLLLGQLLDVPRAEQTELAGTQLYTFGLHLFHLGDYYRAITELKRFAFLFPDHPRLVAAQLLIGLALQEDKLYDDAFVHFQHLQRLESETDVGSVAVFKLGEVRLQQEQYRQAIGHFQGFLRLFPGSPLAPHATYLLGLASALDGQMEQAQRILTPFPTRHTLSEQALALQQALQTAPPLPTKSPQTAGILAGLLPGAGHLYLGKPQQAITAFLLNGLFLTGAAFAFHEGLEAVGAILLYFETGWYLGNIKSAVDGARDTQQQHQSAFVDWLRTTYTPPVLTLQHLQAPALGLRLAF
jgi:tetratricopeptide (TPR) repeat protein